MSRIGSLSLAEAINPLGIFLKKFVQIPATAPFLDTSMWVTQSRSRTGFSRHSPAVPAPVIKERIDRDRYATERYRAAMNTHRSVSRYGTSGRAACYFGTTGRRFTPHQTYPGYARVLCDAKRWVMNSDKDRSERFVVGPNGERLTRADLPDPDIRRWVPRRKAQIVAAVEGGLLSRETALEE